VLSLVLLPLVFPSYNGGGSDQIKGLVEEFMDRIYSSCTLGLLEKEAKEKPVEVRCSASGIVTEIEYDEQGRSRQIIVRDDIVIEYTFSMGTSFEDNVSKEYNKRAKPGKPIENVTFTLRKGESIFCRARVWFKQGGLEFSSGIEPIKKLTWDEAHSKSVYYADKDILRCTHEFVFYLNVGEAK
jgi:YD repeat-containing protein